ncbi:Protein glass [Frankliniella fusca]|uniref:Protein glass n=1 Tax=Frankliniella fusca TaxID=407009 RepID=A0AAE1H620_9NEOP|nr:Protein glass [Frankliniella fusca]
MDQQKGDGGPQHPMAVAYAWPQAEATTTAAGGGGGAAGAVWQRQRAPRGSGAAGNPFQCTLCGKVLSNRTSLNVHVRSHTGERPYRCTVCPAAFTDLSNWRRHRVVHTKAKRYQCQACPSRFSQSGNLRMHVRKHHPELS